MPDTVALKPPTDAQSAWVARVLGVSAAPSQAGDKPPPQQSGSALPKPVGPRPAAADKGVAPDLKGMALWKAERVRALAGLKQLEEAIRKTDDPERDEAVILLRAIQANLTAEPSTLRQVDELERYLNTDDIIATAEEPNPFGMTIELRTPLARALASLRAEHSAAGGVR